MAKRPVTERVEKSPASKDKEIVFVKPYTDCPVFYSNIGQVSTSKNDVRLVLCNAIDQTDAGHNVSPQVVIYLPHLHARKIAEIILEQAKVVDSRD